MASTDNPTPLYLQLAHALEADIRAGVYPPRQALPSERALVETRQVSRVTARKAIDVLVERGLVLRRHGSGNFIAPRLVQSPSALASFSHELRQRGFAPSNYWLEQCIAVASSEEAQALGLAPDERVACLKRLRLADGVPMAYETRALPEAVLPLPEQVGESLYSQLAAAGHMPVRARQHIRAANATDVMAVHLGIPPGTALLWVTRTSFDHNGRTVEYTQTYCRDDYYDFVSELGAIS